MKKELKLLQSKVVANIEKELKAASDKGEKERGAAFAEANELIACINADAKRLHGDSANAVGSATKLTGPGLLVDAAKDGDIKMVRELLAAGADVNHTKEGDEGRTALYKAAGRGYLEIVKALVGAKADVNKPANNGITPRQQAYNGKHTSVVDYLKTGGAQMGPGALFDAAEKGDAKMVRELLAVGADVNHTKKGDEGRTALFKAAGGGQLEAAQALIGAGADVDKGRTDGATPLYMAAQKNHLQAVQALIDAGADVDRDEEDGYTPLICAAFKGHLEVVKALVGAKASVNKVNNSGRTPLENAIDNDQTSVIEYLKSVGAR
jgi:ankyrin repeat protein